MFRLRKSDYHPFTLLVDDSNSSGALTLSLVKKLSTSPIMNKHLLLERNTEKNVKNQSEKRSYDELVEHCWILEEGERHPKHLELQHSKPNHHKGQRTWGPVKCGPSKCFDLWLDFGTETPGEKRILNQWANLLTQQDDVDVEFNVQGEQMGAHASVLLASSSAFSDVLHRRPKTTRPTQTVHVSDVEPQIFEQMLHYVYTGRIPLMHVEGMVEKLSEAAVKFGLDNLIDECARFMLANLSVSTVARTLIWSCKHSMDDLFELSFNFAASNFSKVIEDPTWKSIENHPKISLRISKLISNESTRGT